MVIYMTIEDCLWHNRGVAISPALIYIPVRSAGGRLSTGF